MSEHVLSAQLLHEASWPGADTAFPGSPNEISLTRATALGCGFWRGGGTASVFRSAIACGRGEIFKSKLGSQTGRATTEPTQFTCSKPDESRFFGQQCFAQSRRTISKRTRTCQGGSLHKC